jgi:aryl-alcohol dehydrogenase-like predicted oxidoreductase
VRRSAAGWSPASANARIAANPEVLNYQIHRPDHTTDIEETLSVLRDLVSAGKIRAFGCSAFPAEDIVEAYHVADRRGYGRFRTNQRPYSMMARGIERSVLPTCRRLGMAC